MYNKQTFINTINVLKEQYDYDEAYTTQLESLIHVEGIPSYNNSILINHIMGSLQAQFIPLNGDCEIERYCYELNFGYIDGIQRITPEDLWTALIDKKSLVVD